MTTAFFSFPYHLNFFRTLTSPVELLRCLKSIKEHAFSASSYPLIITLEDHLTPDLQAKVAKVDFIVYALIKFRFMLYLKQKGIIRW